MPLFILRRSLRAFRHSLRREPQNSLCGPPCHPYHALVRFAAGTPRLMHHAKTSHREPPPMTRPLRYAMLACASFLLVANVARSAPVTLDAPALNSDLESVATIHLDVVAGSSGAPYGFTVQWLTKAQFDALGGWPADPSDPLIQEAIFLGTPTLNTVDGTYSFLLGAGESAGIEIGDIFDETGILSSDRGEMSQGTNYVFRVRADGDGS